MRRAGASYENAHVVDSLCCPSRASIFTGQAPHQTGVLTNTPNDPATRSAATRRSRSYGNAERSFNVALAEQRLHDRVRRQVPQRLRDVERRRQAAAAAGRARVGRASRRSWVAATTGGASGAPAGTPTGRCGSGTTPKPPRTAPVDELDRHYATNVAVRPRGGLHEQAPRRRSAVLPRGRDLRSARPDDEGLPRQPAVPVGVRRPGTRGRPDRRELRHAACGALTLEDLKGYGDPREDNAPTYLQRNGTTRPAPAWNTNPVTLTRRAAR